jgi:hypothetical protein
LEAETGLGDLHDGVPQGPELLGAHDGLDLEDGQGVLDADVDGAHGGVQEVAEEFVGEFGQGDVGAHVPNIYQLPRGVKGFVWVF